MSHALAHLLIALVCLMAGVAHGRLYERRHQPPPVDPNHIKVGSHIWQEIIEQDRQVQFTGEGFVHRRTMTITRPSGRTVTVILEQEGVTTE